LPQRFLSLPKGYLEPSAHIRYRILITNFIPQQCIHVVSVYDIGCILAVTDLLGQQHDPLLAKQNWGCPLRFAQVVCCFLMQNVIPQQSTISIVVCGFGYMIGYMNNQWSNAFVCCKTDCILNPRAETSLPKIMPAAPKPAMAT
jgi:hypothetical protein